MTASFWDTSAGREGLAAWNMDRDDQRRYDERGEYCPICNFLLAAHLSDFCPTEAEVAAWWGR